MAAPTNHVRIAYVWLHLRYYKPMKPFFESPCLVDLSTYGLVKVSGSDAARFLQGQLMCDVESIGPQSQLTGYCNAQGRLVSIFRISKIDGEFYLRMPREIIATTLEKLKKYAKFSKVEIHDISTEWSVYGISGMEIPADGEQEIFVTRLPGAIPRFEIIGKADNVKAFVTRLSSNFTPQSSDYWRWLDIMTGIPTVYRATQEIFLPHRVNLHTLGGISFTKGCYIGQEIIARLHYKGTLKHHMYFLQLTTPIPLYPGLSLTDSTGGEIGKIVDCYLVADQTYQALAVLLDEHAEDSETYIEQIAIPMAVKKT